MSLKIPLKLVSNPCQLFRYSAIFLQVNQPMRISDIWTSDWMTGFVLTRNDWRVNGGLQNQNTSRLKFIAQIIFHLPFTEAQSVSLTALLKLDDHPEGRWDWSTSIETALPQPMKEVLEGLKMKGPQSGHPFLTQIVGLFLHILESSVRAIVGNRRGSLVVVWPLWNVFLKLQKSRISSVVLF